MTDRADNFAVHYRVTLLYDTDNARSQYNLVGMDIVCQCGARLADLNRLAQHARSDHEPGVAP